MNLSTSDLSIAPTEAGLPEKPYTSPSQLAEFFGVSRRTIWYWIASGRLPQPLRISRNVVRWERAALVAFIEKLKDCRVARRG
jgi:predicted DNA-binding transcriptional regulator AlpA